MEDWVEFVTATGSKLSVRPFLINAVEERIVFEDEFALGGELVGTTIRVDTGNETTDYHLEENYADVMEKIIEAEKREYQVKITEPKEDK